ncbi:hypothetical protein ACFS07_30440 [Undibacterium arcticum]
MACDAALEVDIEACVFIPAAGKESLSKNAIWPHTGVAILGALEFQVQHFL